MAIIEPNFPSNWGQTRQSDYRIKHLEHLLYNALERIEELERQIIKVDEEDKAYILLKYKDDKKADMTEGQCSIGQGQGN